MTELSTLTPELEARLEQDTTIRLKVNGMPLDPLNDYERHLFARSLRRAGFNRDDVRLALLSLGLHDVAPHKRQSYIDDVLNSILVGFPDGDLPVWIPEGEE